MKASDYRKILHQIPELGYEEKKTTAFLIEHLKTLTGKVIPLNPTGVAFYMDNGKKETIGYRSDIDALPITEKTKLPFSSKHPGKMHACGHDGHMAMLLSFIDYCQEHLRKLPYNVLCFFQPAEETGSGAQVVIQSGILEKYHVKAIFGFHVWPQLPEGKVFSKAGGLLAQCSEIDLTIKGKASHIANASEGIDALQIAAAFLTELYQLEEAKFQDFPHLLKFGQISGGVIRNVLAAEVEMKGSLRSFSSEHHAFMKAEIQKLADKYEEKTKGKIVISYTEGYPVVNNDGVLFEKVQHVLPELKLVTKPFLQGEDFGQYTEKYPCVFFLLGLGDVPPLHNEAFDFKMELLNQGVATYIQLLQLA